jgi:hypothetical protein
VASVNAVPITIKSLLIMSPTALWILSNCIIIHTKISSTIGLMMTDEKKSKRFQLILPVWLDAATRRTAQEKGISASEYIKDALKEAIRRDQKDKD